VQNRYLCHSFSGPEFQLPALSLLM
jgi:hypothetical protein